MKLQALRHVLLTALLAWGAQAGAAPTNDQLAVYRQYLDFATLVRGGEVQPNWMLDGSSFWYVDGDQQQAQIVKVDPVAGTREPLFDVARLRKALKDTLGSEPPGLAVPFSQFQFTGADRVMFGIGTEMFQMSLGTYDVSRVTPPSIFSLPYLASEAERATPKTFLKESFSGLGPMAMPEVASPDGKWFASTSQFDLVLRATVDGRDVRVTHDGTAEVFWDLEPRLWSPWSPDAQRLVVFKQDTRGVPRIPTIKWLKPLEESAEVLTFPAGARLYRSEVHLFDVHSLQSVKVDLGDTTDRYLRVLSWLPDSSALLIASYNRTLSTVDILAIDSRTGGVRRVLSEVSKTFLTNHHEALWGTETGFTLLPDGSGFIWASERDGWDHLYLYDLQGKLVRRLTSGEFPVKDVVRVDQQGKWVYFTAHGDTARPYDTHLYRVGLDGKGFKRLTEGKGQHKVSFAPSAQYFVDTFSTVDTPPKTVLRKADGTMLQTLGEADISRLQQVGWMPPREHVVKAADGTTDLWVTMYYPYDFDANRQYPVVEHIYGGPQTAWRPMDFGAIRSPFGRSQNFNRALANLGFIVVVLDARGTPERSKAFHDLVYRSWGKHEIADHATAIRQLAQRFSFIDIDRVGIYGGSWGGQFAFRALAQEPDLYKAAISEAPGFDPRRIVLYEPYLGMPIENKALYDAADPFLLAPALKGDLLLLGGANDTGTQADLFKMSELLIRMGKPHEMMVYPESGHGAMGATAEYDMDLKRRFFLKHLGQAAE